MYQYAIGIDIGTTNTKALLFDRSGKTVKKTTVDYTMLLPQPSFREENPDIILNAVISALKDAVAAAGSETIGFVAFSSMMHSLIAVDKDGKPLTNCILWADSRSQEYVENAKVNGTGLKIYKHTGTPCHPMSPLYKIMWMRDHEPAIFMKAAKFISIKEYVFFRLFGKYLVDYSIASATGMFNLFTRTWDTEALKLAGIDESRLSPAVPTTECITGMKDSFREKIGLGSDTVYIVGASDGCLANLGSGAVKTGSAAVTVGTSGAVRICTNKPVLDPSGRIFCYFLTTEKYIVGGPVNNGGSAYRWFRDVFCKPEKEQAKSEEIPDYTYVDQYVNRTPAGSHGLVFLPFLMGERAPYWNSRMWGSYMGITDSHTKEDFARATVEGICYAINSVYRIVLELTGPIKSVYADGGFTGNQESIRILSDILNADITVLEHTESSCLGAFILGMHALGDFPDLEKSSGLILQKSSYRPRPENRKIYDASFSAYSRLISALLPVYKTLSVRK